MKLRENEINNVLNEFVTNYDWIDQEIGQRRLLFLWNLLFCGTILPNFMFLTQLILLRPYNQGLFKGFLAFFPILGPW